MSTRKRKVCVVVSARASYARIRSALVAIKARPDLDLILVTMASAVLDRYGNAESVIEQDGFEIAERVFTILEGQNLITSAKSTGLGIVELATVLGKWQPDVVVTVADRFETMATAIASSYLNIPLAHVQGGEVTGSIDERVRHSVTKLADLHFVSSTKARERVVRMGENPDAVFVTGCPSIDIAAGVLRQPDLDFDPFERYGGVGPEFELAEPYLVVAQHPVTTEYDAARQHVWETLRAVESMELPTLWFWPNVDAGSDGTSNGIRTFRETVQPRRTRFFKNMHPNDFLRLAFNSACLVGNSSVALREGAFLGIPGVNVGSRQGTRDRSENVIDVGYQRDEIRAAIEKQVDHGRYQSSELYGRDGAGVRIAELLATAPLEIEKSLFY